MLGRAIQPEIDEMIADREFDQLLDVLKDFEYGDIVDIIEDLPASRRALVFRLLPHDLATEVFAHLEIEEQEQLIRDLNAEDLGELLNDMPPDDRTRLLEELPGGVAQRLIKTLEPEELRVARALLGYPEDSVGRLMTPEYVAARPDWTREQTIEFIRETGGEAETVVYIYVVDDQGRLIDDLHLGRLVTAAEGLKLSEMTEENVVALQALEDREEAVDAFKKYDRVALPVVDSRGVLLGIVTVDDMLDVEEDEATEDVQMFGGQAALEDSYFHTSNFALFRKRAGWLTFLFAGGLVTSIVMQGFEDVLADIVILSLFIPLVLSSGGNSGSQSASLIIRGLAVKEFDLGDWSRVLVRELMIGLSLGLFLAVILVGYFAITGFDGVAGFAVVSSIAVTCIVVLGTLCGALMPFLFKRIGFDPAVSSGPFIATFVDLSGIYLYLFLAREFITR